MREAELLARAAAAYGIEARYTDIWGKVHETSPEVMHAMLAAQGFHAGSAEEIECLLAAREAARWRAPLEPVYVVRDDADHIRLNIPAIRGGASVKLEIEWENSEVEHHWFRMPELRTLGTARVEANDWIAKRLPLPKPLPPGYHRICMHWMQEPQLETLAEAPLIVSPNQLNPLEGPTPG